MKKIVKIHDPEARGYIIVRALGATEVREVTFARRCLFCAPHERLPVRFVKSTFLGCGELTVRRDQLFLRREDAECEAALAILRGSDG